MANDASFTGSIPEHYDRGLGPILFADFATDMARRVAAHHPARVLETAAGTGIVTRKLRDSLAADAQLAATDLNPPMLDRARGKFRAGEKVTFQPADAMALPFADASFDAVVCQFGIMFYPDKPLSYREVHRVLAPGGHYLFSTWDSHRHNAYAAIAHRVVGSVFPADPPQFYQVPFSCHQIDPIKEALLDAGFADIDISVLHQQRPVPDLKAFATGLVYGNPLIEQIKARGGDPEQVLSTMLAELQQSFGTAPIRIPLQVLVFSARKP